GSGGRGTFTYYACPTEHWRRIRTNNPLERILREIRRRTRVVGAFSGGQSALTSRRKAAPHRRHGVVDQKISEHRVVEGLGDERCRHRVSQGRAPLSQPKVRKIPEARIVLAGGRCNSTASTLELGVPPRILKPGRPSAGRKSRTPMRLHSDRYSDWGTRSEQPGG